MDVRHETGERLGGYGCHLRIDAARPLIELTAEVNAFCARADGERAPKAFVVWLSDGPAVDRSWPGEVGTTDVTRWEKAVRALERIPAVSIAAVAGTCGGPALDLLLATDYRFATADLRLLLPVSDGHFWPGMAVHRLVTQVGVARARQLVLWGTQLSVGRAVDVGLVDEVVDDLDDAVRAATVWLGRDAGSELAVRRQLLLEAAVTGYEEALGVHLAACDRELRRRAEK